MLSKVLGVSIDYLVVGKECSSVKEELERVINQLEKIRMDIGLKDCVWRRCKDECETLDHKISTICARN